MEKPPVILQPFDAGNVLLVTEDNIQWLLFPNGFCTPKESRNSCILLCSKITKKGITGDIQTSL